MFEHFLLISLSISLTFVLSIALGHWLFAEDRAIKARHKLVAQFAAIAKDYGLVVTADIMQEYAAYEYGVAVEKFLNFCKVVLHDVSAFEKELEQVFTRMLDRELAKPAGLALIQAKIAALATASEAPGSRLQATGS